MYRQETIKPYYEGSKTEQVEQARNVMKIMFAKYADYFDKKENDDET